MCVATRRQTVKGFLQKKFAKSRIRNPSWAHITERTEAANRKTNDTATTSKILEYSLEP